MGHDAGRQGRLLTVIGMPYQHVGGGLTPDLRAALLITAESLPAGTAVPVVREVLIELLAGSRGLAPAPAERMLTAAEVAGLLGTTQRWAYAHADQLGAKRLSRRCLRFPESAIRRRMERRQ